MEEQWKAIPEFPQYEASTLGNVRNSKTKRVMKPYQVPDGYMQVRLSLGSNANFKVCRVHRLIATTWIQITNGEKKIVKHKNGVRSDNRVVNLEWAAINVPVAEAQREQVSEVWRRALKYPQYSISSHGRIRNDITQKVLCGHTKSTYDQVKLPIAADNYKSVYIHKLVAEAFLPSYTDDMSVVHKDGNKKNNRIENLECMTHGAAIQYSYARGQNPKQVSVSQYSLANELIEEFPSFAEAERMTGFPSSSIRFAKKEKRAHQGFLWK